MNRLLLFFTLFSATVSAQEVDTAKILRMYDNQTIVLEPSSNRYQRGRDMDEIGIFNQKMVGKLSGDEASALILESSKRSRRGFWGGMGSLVLVTGAVGLSSVSSPVAIVVLTGGVVWYIYSLNQLFSAEDLLHKAVWHHNREVVKRAVAP